MRVIRGTGDILNHALFSAGAAPDSTDENGKIQFTLKHGQVIKLKDVPFAAIEVSEITLPGYTASWRDSKLGVVSAAKDGKTGLIALNENEDRTVSFYNDKSMVPPVGVHIDFMPFAFIGIISTGGLCFIIFSVKNKKRLRFA